jgi:hypothetical protein
LHCTRLSVNPLHSRLADNLQLLLKTETCAVPSCPLTDTANGQLAQQQLLCLQFSVPRAGTKGSALAPHATPGSERAPGFGFRGPLPASLSLHSPPLWAPSTKEMRIAPVIEGMVIPQVTGVARGSRSGPAPRGRALGAHRADAGAGGEGLWSPQTRAPGPGSTVLRIAGVHFAQELEGRRLAVICHRELLLPRSCSRSIEQLRPGAEIFPPKLWSNFSQPLPPVTPRFIRSFKIVWWGAAQCPVVR